MKEPMKHIILAAAMLCRTAQAEIHGVPSNPTTCAMAGAIAAAATTHQQAGISKEKTVKAIESAIKNGATKSAVPQWVKTITQASWDATAQVPDITSEMANEAMTERCLAR